MDRVRFGRALGYGARHAAKAMMQAADAATTSSGSQATQRSAAPARVSPSTAPPRPLASSGATTARATRAASKSFLQPIKRYSGTVLLQMAGTFFAVFALILAQSAWRLREGFHQKLSAPESQHFWLPAALSLVFAWFAITSFLRARRLERS